MTTTRENFWDKVEATGFCWLWTGYVRRTGYGAVGFEGRKWLVHRLAYEILVGPIPDGLVIDHLCRVKHCVNPDHLEPVTAEENTRRGFGVGAKFSRRTHCLNGHEWTEENTGMRGGKWRYCKSCERTKAKAKWAARKLSEECKS